MELSIQPFAIDNIPAKEQLPQYIMGFGIYYKGILQDTKRHRDYFQPIFEAFTNSLEAIDLRSDKSNNGSISIKIFLSEIDGGEPIFQQLKIEDTGIGFNKKEFHRFTTYKDNQKGFNNRGSGRIQLIHYFEECHYVSVYKTDDGFKEREFVLSKNEKFLAHNSITLLLSDKQTNKSETGTSLRLIGALKPTNKFFNNLNAKNLKDSIILHYIQYLCSRRERLPFILIEQYVNEELKDKQTISTEDVPEIDQTKIIKVQYSALSRDGKGVEKLDKNESFTVQSFKINKEKLSENSVKLTSKGEVINTHHISLDCLSSADVIDNKRYLFLVSSAYIDDLDGNVRGDIKILTKEEFKRESNIFDNGTILLEDLKEITNKSILELYPEISAKVKEHSKGIEKLKSMFLISDDTIKSLSLSLNDSEEQILEKVYVAEAKVTAQKDAKIKEKIDNLEDLDPSDKSFESEFNNTVADLVKQIPLQNRTSLTHYVARRKLVLDLFKIILNKKLKVQREGLRNIDEKLLHNLIFKQGSSDPGISDLWLVNEDFIYFKGTSEVKLGNLSVDGVKIMKEDPTEEEIKYRDSLEERRYDTRPDVLLFPSEGKCIIIEFKNPDVNVSDHLNQISNYASIIRNLSKDAYNFKVFYGYLVGEKLDPGDVQNKDSAFVEAVHFNYVFKPYYRIIGKFGRTDGALYTEAIQYSTLLDRAEKRNEIFIKNLTNE
ncbi:ATP-binding protein [Larkinella sp. GY13]|uniref:ATP-binding protein n=1 Tax=Larkinella sp. GY13 TaxID=3453720 RepID=UPI003EEC6B22